MPSTVLRRLIGFVLASAAAGLLAACGGTGTDAASPPSTGGPSTSVTSTDGLPPLCDTLPLFVTSADQLADGTMMARALEGLPEETAVSRASDSAGSVDTFGSLIGDELPDALDDEVTLIMEAAAAFDEHLQAGGEPADVDNFTGSDEFDQARESLRVFLDGDSGC